MRVIRIFFDKTEEAAYISHLDLQRVMARALRKSGLPVWYSEGFNPHIYQRFSLPLPLLQESFTESVDCKTEAEGDMMAYVEALNKALPRGIVVKKIAPPLHKSDAIRFCEYHFVYEGQSKALQAAWQCFLERETASVLIKRKKTQQEVDLKQVVSQGIIEKGDTLSVVMPAGNEGNINPQVLATFLQDECALPEKGLLIRRMRVLLENGEEFA